ncbi:alpha/beta hydrolase family protein [Bacillus massilinigeriensis]|uniref:alpha/beta hydrolase family protein n=1 Tax=Bacillus massilionigeriensis TaxID=1805475 RepID=UPI00096B2FC5|nr:alpha/beta fold hydrolase [Bacillus massilionigeriensis]
MEGLTIKVILVHGFNKSSRDMRHLERYLNSLGYHCFLPDLQLTYKEVEHATYDLAGYLEEVVKFNLKEDERIHLVGHSTGGLVIRKLLSDTKYSHQIGRCVLIATPNKGSKLADIAGNVRFYVEIFKTLKSLTFESVKQLKIANDIDIEMAAIAGNKSNLLLGKLIRDENDGRVEVESVYFPKLKDFMILPYGHKEIHYQEETARLVDAFLMTGKFK